MAVNRSKGERLPRVPFEPLFRLSGATTMKGLSRSIGCNRRQMYRWKRDGLTYRAADQAAVALGMLPYEIWDEYGDAA